MEYKKIASLVTVQGAWRAKVEIVQMLKRGFKQSLYFSLVSQLCAQEMDF